MTPVGWNPGISGKNMDRVRKVLVAYSQRDGGDCFKGYTCARVVRCFFSGENKQYIQTYTDLFCN